MPASEPLLSAWLSAQTNISSWSADVSQTRSLKTLSQPLISSGHVWFTAPNRFRWEIGDPPSTIAVRKPDEMMVIYPKLKRAERYPLAGAQPGPWKDALALLEAGFPRSREEIESRFRILSQVSSNDVSELALQPRSASARRLMPEIRVSFHTTKLVLLATELRFADGSVLRNDFHNPKLNPELSEELFRPELSAEYQIVEPIKQSR